MKIETKMWFACLEGVVLEFKRCSKIPSIEFNNHLINVMRGAGISLDEVREAQEMDFGALNRSMVLIEYEGVLMEQEEMEE